MKIVASFLILLLITAIYCMPLFAQIEPPMLPKPPEQAPLGAMGLIALAAGGGTYAWKKLRGMSE